MLMILSVHSEHETESLSGHGGVNRAHFISRYDDFSSKGEKMEHDKVSSSFFFSFFPLRIFNRANYHKEGADNDLLVLAHPRLSRRLLLEEELSLFVYICIRICTNLGENAIKSCWNSKGLLLV